MTRTPSLIGSLGALAAAGLLAGCAGAGSAPPTSSSVIADAAQCKVDHGVSVNPCSVSLGWSDPKATVKTSGPKGGTFSFNDKACSTEGIATVTGSGDTYVVDWGSKSGTCSVVFSDKVGGKTVGTAKLSVKNTV